MEPAKLKEKYGDRLTFWGGGVDTQKTLPFGTPAEVREQVLRALRDLRPGRRLCLQRDPQRAGAAPRSPTSSPCSTPSTSSTVPARWERSAPLRILAGALLLLMAVLAGGSALRESVTIDEVAHIGAAVSYLQRLDVRFNGEHPPLPKIIAALPLVLRGVKADYSSAPWQRAADRHMAQWVFGEWVLERWNDPQTVLLWTRLPMLALTLALGWTVFVIGRRLGGDWGGLLSLTAYATSPTFLAFGPLVVTDVSVALFSLLTLWTFANLWRNPDTPLPSEHLSPPEHLSEPRPEGAVKGRFTTHSPRRRVIQFGAALACAILSKFTAGILLLAFVAVTLSLRWKPLPNLDKEARRTRLRATAQGILLAAAIVYAVYLVLSWNQPTR